MEAAGIFGLQAELISQETGSLLQYTVTDALGRFWFGPLEPDTLYFLRVQKPDGPVRIVELSK